MKVGREPHPTGPKNSGATLGFNSDWISVQPSQQMADVDSTSEFIDNNVFLTAVPTPKLGSRILWVGGESRFLPGSSGLSGSCSSPEHNHSFFDSLWLKVVGGNELKRTVMLGTGSTINGTKVASGCTIPNLN